MNDYIAKLHTVIKFTFNDFYKSLNKENYKELLEFLNNEINNLIVQPERFIMYDFFVMLIDKLDDYDNLIDTIRIFNLINSKLEIMISINKISEISIHDSNIIKLNKIREILDNPIDDKYNIFINTINHEICFFHELLNND